VHRIVILVIVNVILIIGEMEFSVQIKTKDVQTVQLNVKVNQVNQVMEHVTQAMLGMGQHVAILMNVQQIPHLLVTMTLNVLIQRGVTHVPATHCIMEMASQDPSSHVQHVKLVPALSIATTQRLLHVVKLVVVQHVLLVIPTLSIAATQRLLHVVKHVKLSSIGVQLAQLTDNAKADHVVFAVLKAVHVLAMLMHIAIMIKIAIHPQEIVIFSDASGY